MRLFGVKKTIKLGIKSLWMHRLRSILTTLGIVFGVSSVIAMLAIGEGASRETQKAIAQLGSTNVIIETVKPMEERADTSTSQTILNYGLKYADAESIYNTIPDVEVVVPIREIDQEARYMNRKVSIKIIGTIPWYTEISPLRIIQGRFLNSFDLNYQKNICVIDRDVARALFTFDDPIGQDIKIQGSYYRVVGLAEPMSISIDQKDDFPSSFKAGKALGTKGGVAGTVYLPVTTAKIRFGELTFQRSSSSRSSERVELQKITVKVKNAEQVFPMQSALDTLLSSTHKKKDYRIVVPLELLRQAAKTRQIFSIVLGSIAAISLLVGGIGIMNIMLASVSERTREIGIRRALGAKKMDIIVQFLTETVLLTLFGGLFGIFLGSLIPVLVTYFSKMPTVVTGISLLLSFGISGIVGITFGLYPAYRAANMDPIESLRHE
jgi:putative ABC transport system permease protein